jgi:peroxiredoxin
LRALSVDSPEDAERMRASAGLSFDVLSDPEARVIDALDLRHPGAGPTGGDLAQSATFLLSPKGEILWMKVAENYRVRPHPDEILEAAGKFF